MGEGISWGALGLSLLIAYGMIQGLQKQPTKINQEVDITQTHTEVTENSLCIAAVAAMVKLGNKKKEAKDIVKALTSRRVYYKVEEIIRDAYRRSL
jgi:Holliday junction resolvasome RuvABC DNA-binding subunit